MNPPPSIRPADWARMSWHQRERARRRFLAQLEQERPARVPDEARDAIRGIVHAIHQALIEEARAQRRTQPTRGRVAACGTYTGARRHRREGEPICDPCREAERKRNRERRARVRDTPAALTPAQVAAIHDLRAQGMSQRAIAEQVGCGRSTVHRHLKTTPTERQAA